MSDNNLTGNISTIAVWVYVILAPYIATYISQDVFLAIVGIILAVWSSSNPNSFKILGNYKKCECNCGIEETVMNDEYELFDNEEGV